MYEQTKMIRICQPVPAFGSVFRQQTRRRNSATSLIQNFYEPKHNLNKVN